MEQDSIKSDTSRERWIQMLKNNLRNEIQPYLDDPGVIDIMLNPDGSLWVDRLGGGLSDTGKRINPEKGRRIIELVASCNNAESFAKKTNLSGELPESGHRFESWLPPIVSGPMFDIRKKAIQVFTLDDYINQGIMTQDQKEIIVRAVFAKKSILVAGGTGSGKTTLLNAILAEIAKTNDRLVIIEDTVELQCTSLNTVALRARKDQVTMDDLLKSTLRLRPDRIIVGEVRGPEALTLVKSWNTGHGGGCCSIHANTNDCKAALRRIESLIMEANVSPQRELIAETINLVISIEKYQQSRRIKEMAAVKGYENGDYLLNKIEKELRT